MLDTELIKYLELQKEEKYEFKDINKNELVQKLMEDIGINDSYIRDELIYPNLAHLLYDKHFIEEELTVFLKMLISNEYLLFDLKNKEEYSVLKRSFTLLQIAILLFIHRRDHIFDSYLIQETYCQFKQYFENEKIVTGYVKEVGWVHTIAHSADVFAQFMQIETFDHTMLEEMFTMISSRLKDPKNFYHHDEDERMVKAIIKGIERKTLSNEFILDWVDAFSTYDKVSEYPQAYYLTNNIKCFLRSLYFAFLDNTEYQWLIDKIKQDLKDKVTLH